MSVWKFDWLRRRPGHEPGAHGASAPGLAPQAAQDPASRFGDMSPWDWRISRLCFDHFAEPSTDGVAIDRALLEILQAGSAAADATTIADMNAYATDDVGKSAEALYRTYADDDFVERLIEHAKDRAAARYTFVVSLRERLSDSIDAPNETDTERLQRAYFYQLAERTYAFSLLLATRAPALKARLLDEPKGAFCHKPKRPPARPEKRILP